MIPRFVLLLISAIVSLHVLTGSQANESRSPRLWLTITARSRLLQVSWINARTNFEDEILITDQEPGIFTKIQKPAYKQLEAERIGDPGSGLGVVPLTDTTSAYWICNNGSVSILDKIRLWEESQWVTTSIPFDFNLSKNISVHTSCYGFWASYVDSTGKILASNCIRAFPMWMNDMRSAVGGFRIRDLFIPGTHDSGSYRPRFNPLLNETIVTKYALTQDEDIRGQLMHGVRYLDIRVGFYRGSSEKFWVNHGFTRQRPLREVLEQIYEFVIETNEIVIVDIQEFPVGFGKSLDIHRLLVKFIHSMLGDILVSPGLTWQATLRDIWQHQRNVVLSYDYVSVVTEFPDMLFRSVEQRWGNVQKLKELEKFLRRMSTLDTMRLSSRPVADMAELTPDPWGVIIDKFGGLRKLADEVNERLTTLYRSDLGQTANIVAVDFIRGTSIVEVALEWNSKKVILR